MKTRYLIQPAVCEWHGSTGLHVAERLRQLCESAFGEWLPLWPCLLTETTTVEPYGLPSPWRFEALGFSLDKLYPERHRLGLPAELCDLPQELWQDTALGAAKSPATAALAFALRCAELEAWRRSAWREIHQESAVVSLLRRLERRKIVADKSRERPFVILTGSAGGSTGPAGMLQALDFYLGSPERPLVLLFLLGPHCGASHDDYRTERANALQLFLSLQRRANEGGGFFAFWLDGTIGTRATLLDETARLIQTLIASPDGETIRRLLRDGFGPTRRRGLPGEPVRFLCRLDAHRLQVPAAALREHLAVRALTTALSGGPEDECIR